MLEMLELFTGNIRHVSPYCDFGDHKGPRCHLMPYVHFNCDNGKENDESDENNENHRDEDDNEDDKEDDKEDETDDDADIWPIDDRWVEIFTTHGSIWKCDICKLIAVDFTEKYKLQLHKYKSENENTHCSISKSSTKQLRLVLARSQI